MTGTEDTDWILELPTPEEVHTMRYPEITTESAAGQRAAGVKMYTVMHRNGSGGEYSEWYIDGSHLSREDAESLMDKLESQSFEGWKLSVRMIPDVTLHPLPSDAREMGRKGGSSTSPAKRKASATNGKKGGRPRKPTAP